MEDTASLELGLVARLDSISVVTLKGTYPNLCRGLGRIQQPYTIKLKPGAVPHSLKTQHPGPLLLLAKVKAKLEHMERSQSLQ